MERGSQCQPCQWRPDRSQIQICLGRRHRIIQSEFALQHVSRLSRNVNPFIRRNERVNQIDANVGSVGVRIGEAMGANRRSDVGAGTQTDDAFAAAHRRQ